MMDAVLVANRGEIAVRVIRTARSMGYRTIAVYSDADADAPHVALADEAVCIGAPAPSSSYLDGSRILAAAARTGADAIHPGYGFLSENAAFARSVTDAGLVWIGPPPASIEAMGDKAESKVRMRAAGVPCVPGFDDGDPDDAALIEAAEGVGYPLLVKASAGGGGRGMRRVDGPEGLQEAISSARAEALGAFGSDRLLLERLIEDARHVEIQVFADAHGHVVHLGERDCSVQRRHQKVVEEAPSPAVTPEIRAVMGEAACQAALAVDYRGAGTVEFLLASDGSFFFLEMNTRLQVEHPVTEAITGLDLVALQLRVAAGEPLGFSQEDVALDGHAIELRLYAEDPAAGYLPQPGPIWAWDPPSGVRVDHGLSSPGSIPPFYDAMVAKLIASGPDRATAIRKLRRALEETVFFGVSTNRDLLARILSDPSFVKGEATTAYLSDAPRLFTPTERDPRTDMAAAALWAEVFAAGDGFRTSHPGPQQLSLDVDGRRLDVKLGFAPSTVDGAPVRVLGAGLRREVEVGGHRVAAHVLQRGESLLVRVFGAETRVKRWDPTPRQEATVGSGELRMPMSGTVLSVACAVGDVVEVGDKLVRVEAMKLESALAAAIAGTVVEVRVSAGEAAAAGALLVRIEA